MQKKISRKKRYLWIAVVLFLIALAGGIFSLIRPFSVKTIYLRLSPVCADQESFEETISYVNRNRYDTSGQFIHGFDEFDSTSYEDYVHVWLNFEVANHTPWRASVGDGYIVSLEKADFVIYKRPMVIDTYVNSYEQTFTEDGFDLICYRGNMSDEELIDKIRQLRISIYYETDLFNSLSMKMDLSDVVFVTDEEYFSIRDAAEA